MNRQIVPVVLAGGVGTRLWPLSRNSFPKQFLKLTSNQSLLQETVIRTKEVIPFSNMVVVTNMKHKHLCEEQLGDIPLNASISYILEPTGRNTAPAIALAAKFIQSHIDKQALMLILPSDHAISEVDNLKQSIIQSLKPADNGKLVVFGVKPSGPKTGFGYIQANKKGPKPFYNVERFIEKPTEEKAKKFLSSGKYFWNSGMFLMCPISYLCELKNYAPNIFMQCVETYKASLYVKNTFTLDHNSFSKCPSNSIDYAVMEKTLKAVMVPLNATWNDLGSWEAIANTHEKNSKGNVTIGNVLEKDSNNCYLHSEGKLISAVGLKNIVAISTQDAVLIANKNNLNSIKEVVNELKVHFSEVVESHKKVFFEWGYEEIIDTNKLYDQQRLTIKPEASFTYISPSKKTEHFLVVTGKGVLIKENSKESLYPNKSISLSANASYVFKNTCKKQMQILKVSIKSQEHSELFEVAF